jgi:hypothetical protein
MSSNLNPSHILEVGFGFWGSKVILSAVELELFTKLSNRSLTSEELGKILELHQRGTIDFFDSLVALGFLNREGNGASALYSNTTETDTFLDKNKPSYIGGILEMANARLFRFWSDLTPALRSGEPQNEVKHTNKSMFEAVYEDFPRLEQFMGAMRGISTGNFTAFAEKFDFSNYKTLCDIGGATGLLSSLVTKKHPEIKCTTFDLPAVAPVTRKWLEKDNLLDRVEIVSGDFLKDSLPKADVITMGMILHDWNLEMKKHLIKLAYDALPEGGAFVAIENLIDDERRQNAFGLMMSLNMLIEFGDAFDFTGADFWEWCKEAGFKRYEVIHLAGPCSAAIAYK